MTRSNQGLSSLAQEGRKMRWVGWELDTGIAWGFVVFNINPVLLTAAHNKDGSRI